MKTLYVFWIGEKGGLKFQILGRGIQKGGDSALSGGSNSGGNSVITHLISQNKYLKYNLLN